MDEEEIKKEIETAKEIDIVIKKQDLYFKGFQKGIQQGRTQQKIEDYQYFEKMIDKFSNADNLKISWGDFSVECPICKLETHCFSRISENPRKEICIYCRIRELKSQLQKEKK